jgi:hypothetical protein
MTHQVRLMVTGNRQNFILSYCLMVVIIYLLVTIVDDVAIDDFSLSNVILVRVLVVHSYWS